MMSPTRQLCREDTKTYRQNQLLMTSKTATFPAKPFGVIISYILLELALHLHIAVDEEEVLQMKSVVKVSQILLLDNLDRLLLVTA